MNNQNLKKFTSDYQPHKNGRPKGSISKKKLLKKLIKDLAAITNEITEREKLLVYQLYDIASGDMASAKNISSSVSHLYFIESEFGIKIGISKNVENRLKQVKIYAPSAQIVKIIEFAGKFEKDIHRKFEQINIKNNPNLGIEWFFKTDDLMSFIEEIDQINDLHRFFNPKGSGQLLMF